LGEVVFRVVNVKYTKRSSLTHNTIPLYVTHLDITNTVTQALDISIVVDEVSLVVT